MNLVSKPADFASAFDENLFVFDDVDTSNPALFRFYDGDDNLLGVRRYVGCESVAISPKAFLVSQLNPTPEALVERCDFVIPEGRVARLSVGYDDNLERTPEVLFTASNKSLGVNMPLGESEEWRTISAGECDEIALCIAPNSHPIAKALFANGESISLISRTFKSQCVLLCCINADQILSHSAAPVGATEFDVEIILGGTSVVVHYRVVPAKRDGARIAWLSTDGSIRYHTFPRPISERLRTTRSEGVGMESWQEVSLDSGVLTIAEARRLSEIVASPRIWRLVEGEFEPQTLLGHEVVRGGNQPERVSITLRSPKKTTFSL